MIDSKEIIFVLVPGASQYIHGISNINLFLLFYFGSNFIKELKTFSDTSERTE